MRNVLATCPENQRERHKKRAAAVVSKRSKAAAIRLKCLECCAWQMVEARNCEIRDCALWGIGWQRHAMDRTESA